MDEERTEKATVRALWLQEVQEYATQFPEDEGPIYLTLSGAEGRDIRLLAEHGLVGLTEVGGIVEKDKGKLVAVEASSPAVARLQRSFPNLKILEVNFQGLVRGEGPFNWPQGEHKHHCRARVLNLDLNNPLRAKEREGEVSFPVISWISKLALLHTDPPQRDWSLCLTLHGELNWNTTVSTFTQRFLRENFERKRLRRI